MQKNYEEFDNILKGKLDNIQPPLSPDSWNVFEEKLDSSTFDTTVKSKLDTHSPAYQKDNWQTMSNRIDEEFLIIRKLIKYKIAEVALMILAIITLIPYNPIHNKLDIPQEKGIENINQNIEKPEIPKAKIPDTTTPQKNKSKRNKDLKKKINKPIAKNLLKNIIPPKENNSINKPAKPHKKSSITGLDNKPKLIAYNIEFNKNDLMVDNTWKEEQKPATLDKNNNENQTVAEENISFLASSLLPMPVINERLPLKKILLKRKNVFRFSGVASPDINKVVYNSRQYNEDADTLLAVGYSGGFLFGFKTNRFETQTGLIYSYHKYNPKERNILRIQNYTFSITENFKGTEFHIISLPLNFKYDFYRKNRTRLYALAGGSLNIILKANYDIVHTLNTIPTAAPPSPDEYYATLSRSRYKPAEFDHGFFDSGNFQNNRYLIANVGIGLERYLNPRLSFFFQPTYSQYVAVDKASGIGINKDRINTISLLFGARIDVW